MSHVDSPTAGTRASQSQASDAYVRMQASPEFAEVRRRFRSFAFPITAFFLVWYFAYVLLAAYAPGFMATRVVSTINVGMLLGLGQFVTTFGITIAYVRWASRTFDPLADKVRDDMAGDLR